MIRPVTVATFLMAFGSGLYLYQSKHEVQMLDRTIEHALHETSAVRDQTRMLAIEYTMLTNQERVRQLADTYLALKPIAPTQFTSLADLDSRLPAVVIPPPPEAEPIAASPITGITPPASPIEDETADPPASAPSGTRNDPAEDSSPAPVLLSQPLPVPPLPTPPLSAPPARSPIVATARPLDHPAERAPERTAEHTTEHANERKTPPRPIVAEAARPATDGRPGRLAEARGPEPRSPESRPVEPRIADPQINGPRPAEARSLLGRPPLQATQKLAIAAPQPVPQPVTQPVAPHAVPLAAPVASSVLPVASPYAGSLLGMARVPAAPAPRVTPAGSVNAN